MSTSMRIALVFVCDGTIAEGQDDPASTSRRSEAPMTFRIAETRAFAWPNDTILASVFEQVGLRVVDLTETVRSFTDQTDPDADRYTETLAANLANHLGQSLARNGVRATTRQTTNRYSPRMDHHADLVLARPNAEQRIFFEIEFRPNFEKDLVKFRIGHNSGRLAAGVIIVATDRRKIRDSYTSMPEFDAVASVVKEFRPDHAVLVLGIDGART